MEELGGLSFLSFFKEPLLPLAQVLHSTEWKVQTDSLADAPKH